MEDGIRELDSLLNKLTKGNTDNLSEQSKTNVSSYEDRIRRMSKHLSDLYTYKNDLLDSLDDLENNAKNID